MAPQTSRLTSKWQLFIQYWAPVFLYCGLIIYISSLSYPTRHFPSFFPEISDKLVHAVEYGILGILLFRALNQTIGTVGSMAWAFICTVAFGISDEMHQWFVPERHADPWDLLADAVGGTLFILTWVVIKKNLLYSKLF